MNNEYGYYVNLLGSLNKLIMVVYLLTLLKIKKKTIILCKMLVGNMKML